MAKSYRYHHPVAGIVEVPADVPFEQVDNYILEQAAKTLPESGSIETFFDQIGEGLMSSARGLSQLASEDDQGMANTYEQEFLSRLQLKQSPWAGYSGLLLGSVFDPVTLPAALLKPVAFASNVATLGARGAIGGAVGGGIQPTYEEFQDSRALNIGAGATLGAGLGAGIGKVLDVAFPEQAIPQPTTTKGPLDDVEDSLFNVGEPSNKAMELPPTPTFKSEADLQKETFETVKSELVALAGNRLDDAEVKTIDSNLKALDTLIKDTEEELVRFGKFAAGGTKKQREATQSYTDELFNKLGDYRDRQDALKKQLALNTRAIDAERELRVLGGVNRATGEKAKLQSRLKTVEKQIEDLPKTGRKKTLKALQKQREILTKQLDDFYARTSTPTFKRVMDARLAENQKRIEEYNQKLTGYKARQAEKPTVEEPVQPAPPKTEDDIVNDYEVRTGLQPRGTSAGSAEARPSAVFSQEAGEGVDTAALVKSVTTRKEAPKEAMVRDEGFPLTPMERHRQALRRMASKEQIAKISGVADGRYTVKNIQDLAEELKKRIGQSYDSLMEFVQERVDNRQMFNATEMEILQPLFDEAEAAIPTTMTRIRRLIRADKLDSQEGLEAVQDLQFYNYIANVRLDQRAQASAALRQYNRAKNIRKSQDATVKKGKPVDNLFLGLKC